MADLSGRLLKTLDKLSRPVVGDWLAVIDGPDRASIQHVLERRTIARVLRETNGNKVLASHRLGISRMQLYGRLRKYGLETWAVDAPVADVAHTTPRC